MSLHQPIQSPAYSFQKFCLFAACSLQLHRTDVCHFEPSPRLFFVDAAFGRPPGGMAAYHSEVHEALASGAAETNAGEEAAAKLKLVFPSSLPPTKTHSTTQRSRRENREHICRVGGPTLSRNAVCVDL